MDDAEEEDKDDAPAEMVPVSADGMDEIAHSDLDDVEEKTEGLEAGEAAALSVKKKVALKPIECCITLNRSVMLFYKSIIFQIKISVELIF